MPREGIADGNSKYRSVGNFARGQENRRADAAQLAVSHLFVAGADRGTTVLVLLSARLGLSGVAGAGAFTGSGSRGSQASDNLLRLLPRRLHLFFSDPLLDDCRRLAHVFYLGYAGHLLRSLFSRSRAFASPSGVATSWPLTVTAPLVWTGLEFVRSFLLTGFAWYYLGHTQHHYLAAIQVADLGGVYVISFVMAAVNGWLAEFLFRIPELRKSLRLAPAPPFPRRRFGLAVLTLVSAVFIYGGWRLSQDKFELGPSIALLQGNIDQRILIEASSGADKGDNLKYLTDYYSDMSAIAATVFVPPPDLIVWPETSFPYTWLELPGNLNKVPAETRNNALLVQRFVRRLAADTKTNHLVGLNSVVYDDDKKTQYNSAFLMTEGGAVAGRYDKIHRVPFGEYVPLRDWIPFMNYFAPYDFDYSIRQGETQTRFPARQISFRRADLQ